MINQLSKVYPNLAYSSKPLRDLLSTQNLWFWGTRQQKCFEDLKKELNSKCLLTLFEPNCLSLSQQMHPRMEYYVRDSQMAS